MHVRSCRPAARAPRRRGSVVAPVTAVAATLAVALLLPAREAAAQCAVARLTETAENDLDDFGTRVLLSATTALVSERGELLDGAVHVFDRVGPAWVQTATLQPGASAPGQLFGCESDPLALSGGTLMVGAELDDGAGPDAGAVFVFERDDAGTPADPTDDVWVERPSLHVAGAPLLFGSGVALSGNTAVVGARGSPAGGSAAYVLVRDDAGTRDRLDDTWVVQQTLPPPGLSPLSQFGRHVEISADETLVLVGDLRDESDALGSISSFHRDDGGTPGDPLDDTWVAGARITVPVTADPNGRLDAFALDGDTVLAGAPDGGGFFSGIAFAFERDDAGTPGDPLDDTWPLTDTLVPSAEFAVAGFGRALDLDGDRAVIGAPLWQFPPNLGHQAFVFERTGSDWNEAALLRAPDQQVNDGFGTAVSLHGDRALVGARGAEYLDDWAPADGAAYELDLTRPDPWVNLGHGFLGIYETQLAAWGCLDSEAPVSLRLYNGDDFGGAALVVGLSTVDVPLLGDTLVPSPDFVALGLTTGPWGDLTLEGEWFRAGEVPPGVELFFQMWSFHPTYGPFEAQATNALMVTTE